MSMRRVGRGFSYIWSFTWPAALSVGAGFAAHAGFDYLSNVGTVQYLNDFCRGAGDFLLYAGICASPFIGGANLLRLRRER